MSGRMSRTKGAVGERAVATIFREAGFDVRRTPNSGGLSWKGDLQGLDGFHLEVKRQEILAIPKWLKQARDEAGEGEVPVVVYRRSREEWMCVLPLTCFVSLLSASLSASPPAEDSNPPHTPGPPENRYEDEFP